MNADPHQHARSNDCLTNFLTLNTQLLIQSVSKVIFAYGNHIVGFWIVKPNGDQFPYFSSSTEGSICISKPMFRIRLRLRCPKESP